MSILRKVVYIFLILGLGYTLYGIFHFQWMYHRAENPKESFQVLGNPDGDVTIVEFLNYACGYCKGLHPVLKETTAIRKDIRHVVRPIAYGGEDEGSFRSVKLVFAAALQDKFLEFHEVFLEYPHGKFPDDFVRELSDLYGLDHDQLIKDSESKKVEKMIQRNLAVSNHVTIFSVPSIMIGKNIYMPPDDNLPDLKEMLEIINKAEGKE